MLPPEGYCLPISKLHSILAVPSLHAHNNMSLSYYGQIECSFEMHGRVRTFGVPTIYFGVDGTVSIDLTINN